MFEELSHLPLMDARKSRRFSPVARMMLAIAAVALALPLFGFAWGIIDALSHGPYVTWYNARCQRLCDRANLVGRPEADVAALLGEPTFFYDQPPGSDKQTYNYCPFPFIPTAKFQVHCRGGIVTNVEQFDD